ncbi:MAG: alpha/beta hydrolase [Actinomycetota bacterium]|nr:alpha/beta hydrolase [Actinomycetota bacterium]
MSAELAGFAHNFLPGEPDGSGVTLLLLHGTGGNEDDLIPLGQQLLPGAAILSPRGKVSEHGAPRFFRRLAEGVFDHEDLLLRTHELADFVDQATNQYGFDRQKLVAVSYSNGANIAASLMLLHPDLLRAAVLFRAMVPFEPEETPDLSGVPVFLAAGRRDTMISPDNTERLAAILQEAGADLDLRWKNTGHPLTYEEIEEAREWLPRVLNPNGDQTTQ